MLIQRAQRGDTMIEVLFAVMIFSMVAVGGLIIMNQGAATAQRSLEVILVRQEMDAQAEALRLLHDDAIAQRGSTGNTPASDRWDEVLSHRKAASAVTAWDNMITGGGCVSPRVITDAFIINGRRGTVHTPSGVWRNQASVYSRVLYASSNNISSVEGIWIEAAQHGDVGDTPGYTDFHIRACWETIGQQVPVTLGTIVRLYEP